MPSLPRITPAELALARSLHKASERHASGLYVAEGTRCVLDTLPQASLHMLAVTPAWLAEHEGRLLPLLPQGARVVQASESDMRRLSPQKTPQGILAVYHIPRGDDDTAGLLRPENLLLALDNVQDPGNMGTMIRMADWFGLQAMVASKNTVDAYNPKVVQATMGALARVRVVYVESLPAFLGEARQRQMPLYGTFMAGENLYKAPLTRGGVIVMGNEGNGISGPVAELLPRRLAIPPFPHAGACGMESLNVAMAATVTVAEFRRRIMN